MIVRYGGFPVRSVWVGQGGGRGRGRGRGAPPRKVLNVAATNAALPAIMIDWFFTEHEIVTAVPDTSRFFLFFMPG